MNNNSLKNEYPIITLKQIAESLHPGWDFKKDWLCWPPDIFALVSMIMERTGCYRLCLIDHTWWRDPAYSKIIEYAGKHWLLKVSDLLVGRGTNSLDSNYFLGVHESISAEKRQDLSFALEKFEEIINVIDNFWGGVDENSNEIIDIEKLRTINYNTQKNNSYRKLAEALIQLLAMADVACAGMGLLEKSTDGPEDDTTITHCLANLLLTATGSLSTLSKIHGIVLPKMRTPQGGMTVRSLSHHLTFHTTEVEVMWRTIPWAGHHQKSLNIIAIPFPFTISEDNFETRSERFHSVQYFSYRSTLKTEEAEAEAKYYLDQIVDLVWLESQKLDQVHVLVFPESALTDQQYTYLKKKFYDRLINSKPIKNAQSDTIHYLPLIVAGIHNGDSEPYTGKEDIPGHNEVRIASFFAGKWYDVAQRKHHRWHLNRDQLAQYWLSGKLPSERRWFEHISVAQRRLTILAPTGWLALTSLICEDLAQLEPVSSIIRGIGPTFLMALLSDGPQLNNRWSSRYANVLADDPGTAVLSLTSLGMVKRSRKLTNGLFVDDGTQDLQNNYTVALWKDKPKGQQEINLTNNNKAIRLTISAVYDEEYTLDGRSDGKYASVFRLEGYQQLAFADPDPKPSNKVTKTLLSTNDKKPVEGNWTDIRELTALQFTLDCLIELRGRFCDDICSWFTATPDYKNESYPKVVITLLELTSKTLKNPEFHGIDAHENGWPSSDIEWASKGFKILFNNPTLKPFLNVETSSTEYLKNLFFVAKHEFESSYSDTNKRQRFHYLVPLATINIIHLKVSDWSFDSIGGYLNEYDIASIIELRKEIRQFIITNQYTIYTENNSAE